MVDALRNLKHDAGQTEVGDLEKGMGCPECRSWIRTGTRGRKECNHPDGYRPSMGTLHCANQRCITTATE